jgi:hypothetical protein
MHAILRSIVLLSFVTGCSSTLARPAILPPKDADLATREAAYKRYRLQETTSGFGATFKRADGEYSFREIEAVAQTYPASAYAFDASRTRATALTILAVLGANVIGFTVGYTLAAPPAKQMSTTTQVALYSSGGALLLTPLVVAAATSDPADDIPAAYNAGLRKDLGLPAPRAMFGHTFKF